MSRELLLVGGRIFFNVARFGGGETRGLYEDKRNTTYYYCDMAEAVYYLLFSGLLFRWTRNFS